MSTENLQTVDKIYSALKKHKGFKKDTELAAWLGVDKRLLHAWKARDNIADLEVFIRRGISEEWLRTGRGSMMTPGDRDTVDVIEVDPLFEITERLDRLQPAGLMQVLLRVQRKLKESEPK